MTFLALDAEKSLLILQRCQVEYEQVQVTNQISWCSKQMRAIQEEYAAEDDDSDADYTEDEYYILLEDLDEDLETQQASLDDQITLYNEEINSYKTMVQNNIKSSCGLNLIGS